MDQINQKLFARQANLENNLANNIEFLAKLSHEIRTPVQIIDGIIQTISLGKDTVSYDELKSYVSLLERSNENLKYLIDDLIDTTALQANKVTIIPVNFNLLDLINEVDEGYKEKAISKGLAIKIDFDEDIPSQLYGDAVRLKQIIYNLVNNAIKYSNKGIINIQIYIKEISDNKLLINIAVIDEGIGIRKNDLESIFELFTQVEDKSKANISDGLGLGLTITKQLIKLMDGTIQVHSNFGEGSIFEVTVPLQEPPALEESESKESYMPGSSEIFQKDQINILLAEDYDDNAEIVKIFLNKSVIKDKVNLIRVNNGKEAFDEISSNHTKFDIVMMDLKMPIMDGYKTTQKIRKYEIKNGLKPVPIIAVTAEGSVINKHDFIDMGFNDFIIKPFKLNTLISKISIHF